MPDATLKDIMKFFGMTSQDFTKEWKRLPEKDRKELKAGIGDGTLTY